MDTLDNILSGHGDAVSEQTINEEVTQQAAEGEIQQEQAAEGDQQEGEQQGQRMVPQQALHAEKQKAKRYTEEVSSLRQEIADRDAAWERRIAALMEAQKPKAEPQAVPDWFENPEAATQHAVQRSTSPQFENLTKALFAQAEMLAGIKYGDDKVSAADKAFSDAVAAGTIDPADRQKVLTSPNIYAAAVQWHQRQLAQAEIGDDPAAFRAKLEAEILAKHGLTAGGEQQTQQGQQQPKPVMPSNIAGARNVGTRSGPAWSGPPSLQDIFNRGTG
jgi:hypothetical protein